jgi:hypothetical protein
MLGRALQIAFDGTANFEDLGVDGAGNAVLHLDVQ